MTFKLKTAVAAMAFAVGFGSISYGQTGIMRVSVPFRFHACGEVFPSGTYEIRTDAMAKRVLITSIDGVNACYAPVKVGYASKSSEWSLVAFHSYGSTRFLTRVQNAGPATGIELFTSPAEREMAKLNAPVEIALVPAHAN